MVVKIVIIKEKTEKGKKTSVSAEAHRSVWETLLQQIPVPQII